MSGHDKLPILVFGKFARRFKNVRSLLDNIIYLNSKHAWMTTELFEEYINDLDLNFFQNKRIVGIDNCPAHLVLPN